MDFFSIARLQQIFSAVYFPGAPARLPQLSIQKAVQFAQLDLAICLQPPAKMGGYNPVTKSDASVYRSHLNTSVHVSGEVKW